MNLAQIDACQDETRAINSGFFWSSQVLSGVTPSPQHIETTREISTKKAVARLPVRIVPDAKYPGMYRLRIPDGSLSDIVNLTRAKDALAEMQGPLRPLRKMRSA